jgi:ADP-heptose:LPS heptosyltransferase
MSEAQLSCNLVLFPGALGDFICFLPALNFIADKCEVDLLARTEYSDIAAPSVRTQSLERFEVRRLFVPAATTLDELKKFFAYYAHVYSWTGSGQPLFEQQLKTFSNGSADVFPFRPRDRQTHQADYYLSCLSCSECHSVPMITLRPEFTRWTDKFWRVHELADKPILALAPGSGAQQKNWPLASFQIVAQWWRRAVSGVVLVVLGPVEDERGGYDCLFPEAVVVRGQRLGNIAALLSRCHIYIGNDCGVTHLSAAVGVSTLALFGPSNPRQWAPRGPDVHILAAHADGSPCMDEVLKYCVDQHCLPALNPAQVVQKLEESLAPPSLTGDNPRIRVIAEILPEAQSSITDKYSPLPYVRRA